MVIIKNHGGKKSQQLALPTSRLSPPLLRFPVLGFTLYWAYFYDTCLLHWIMRS